MIETTDFSLPDDANPPAGTPDPLSPAPVVPAPVIVVEYRRGFLARLTPAMLILLAALAITSYQRKSPVRLSLAGTSPAPPRFEIPKAEPPAVPPSNTGHTGAGLSIPAATPPAVSPPTPVATTPPAATTPPPAATAAPPVATAAPPVAPPTPAPAPVTKPAADVAPAIVSPFDLGPADGLKPLDPAAMAERKPPPVASPSPLATDPSLDEPPSTQGQEKAEPLPPEVSKEDILQDIQREAQEKEAQRETMEELKPQAKALIYAENLAKLQASRVPFRNELREALKSFGSEAGPEIDKLCNRYGREAPPELLVALHRAERTLPERITLHDRVVFMRRVGLPEPMILDYLCHKHDTWLRNVRGGPRDSNDIRSLAARVLLSIPDASPAPAASPAPVATTGARAAQPAPHP